MLYQPHRNENSKAHSTILIWSVIKIHFTVSLSLSVLSCSRLYFCVVNVSSPLRVWMFVLVLVNAEWRRQSRPWLYVRDAMQKTTNGSVLISGSRVCMCNEKWIISLLIELITPTNYKSIALMCVWAICVHFKWRNGLFWDILRAIVEQPPPQRNIIQVSKVRLRVLSAACDMMLEIVWL